jgi:hypothetical protein
VREAGEGGELNARWAKLDSGPHRWVVAGTTIWSGLSYVGRKGVNIIKK